MVHQKLQKGNVLHLCVSLGVSVPACTTGHMTRGSLIRGGLCPGGLSPGVSVHGGPCPGGFLSGSLCPGVSFWGGSLSRGVSVRDIPPYGNERAVRILPECILVSISILKNTE